MAKKDIEKMKNWEEKINDYKRNSKGKSQSKWCKENNINSRSFNYWYCKFKRMEMKENSAKVDEGEEYKKNQTKWIHLEVEEKCEDKGNEDKGNNETGIIISIGKTKIEVNKGFDRGSLIEVLKVVNLL